MNDAAAEFCVNFGLTPTEVEAILGQWGVPVIIFLGLVMTESSGDMGALRYEKHFDYLYGVPDYAKRFNWTQDTEAALQRFSYGLTQIMLATARWRGYQGHPKELFSPRINLTWGAFHFKELFEQHKSWEKAVSAYNQGSPAKNLLTGKYKNQDYVDKVFRFAEVFADV